MEPRNFSSPDANDKSREARLNKLRERRNRSVTSISEVVPRPTNFEPKVRSEGSDDKVKPLPNRQGRVESRPDRRIDQRPSADISRLEPKVKKKSNGNSRSGKVGNKPLGWQVLRLAIASVGLSVIAGTAISFWQNQQQQINQTSINNAEVVEKKVSEQEIIPLELKTEATSLTAKIKELAATQKDLVMQMMAIDLDSGTYVQVGATQKIAAASTIKTPLLVAFFQDVDAGKIKLDELLEISEDVMVGEAGDFQGLPLGTKKTALETATQMIVISDNTATNMIIKRLGGLAAVNQRFQSWGLNNIVANNKLPDLEGTNTISTQDMVTILAMVSQGKLMTPRSRDRFMDIMSRPITRTLLPQGIGADARIFHKTGDIGSAVGDAGIIDMPNGKRYAIAVMVTRPNNDQRANELIRQISRASYDYFLNDGKLPADTTTETEPDNVDAPEATPENPNSGSTIIENISIPLPNNAPSSNP
ncbi:MAG: serine hydrolase [Pseudanabaena sp.]|nr:MAG: serine hydrolase [Pseudanabaena sp.]